MSMIQSSGGLEGILAKFRASGHGTAVDSWVGTSDNHPITATQVTDVIGHNTVADMAKKLGLDPGIAGGALASMLPELVNQLTPEGKVPANSGDLLSQGLEMLKKLGK